VSAAATDTSPTNCAERKTPKHGIGYEQHPDECDDEHGAAEENGAARGLRGDDDRLLLRPAGDAFFAVTGDDEEGVVDPERETHARDHVDDEDRQRERVREHAGQADGDEDGKDREDQWHEPADDRSEHEQQNDQRGRQAKRELAGLQVVLRQGIEVVRESVVAGDVHGEAVATLLRPNHRVDRRDVSRLANGDQHGVPIGRHTTPD
jgi:hypothetical protein